MEEGRLPVRRAMMGPQGTAARLLLAVAAVLGLLAMHSITQVGTNAGARDHPAGVSAAAVVGSSDREHGGCCATACEVMTAVCVAPPRVMEFTAVGIDAVAVAQSNGQRPPAAWRATAHAPLGRSIGLVIAVLAVARI
jgi:hypothetical protein